MKSLELKTRPDTRGHIQKAKKGSYPLSGEKHDIDPVRRRDGWAELMYCHSCYMFTESVLVQTRQYQFIPSMSPTSNITLR